MFNVAELKFKTNKDKYGCLIPIESRKDIPFQIERVYTITNVPDDVKRGFHAHRKLHQVLVCLNGNVKIRTIIPNKELITELNDSSIGLYIGPFVWREMYDFSKDCVLLVLASEFFDENDYIRNKDFYYSEAIKYFGV